MNVKDAPIMAIKNKDTLPKECSCYYCLKNFSKEKIQEWTDQSRTAICPYCHVDSVIPQTNMDELKAMQKYWF